ncbi:MAG TPA: hypothetical protein VK674_05075 [Candidatus Limnocylindria bacterium]|nr:hypothetical protein [Candidatus Limnocylindria bacterium]
MFLNSAERTIESHTLTVPPKPDGLLELSDLTGWMKELLDANELPTKDVGLFDHRLTVTHSDEKPAVTILGIYASGQVQHQEEYRLLCNGDGQDRLFVTSGPPDHKVAFLDTNQDPPVRRVLYAPAFQLPSPPEEAGLPPSPDHFITKLEARANMQAGVSSQVISGILDSTIRVLAPAKP